MALDDIDRRYAEATHRVIALMKTGDWTVAEVSRLLGYEVKIVK